MKKVLLFAQFIGLFSLWLLSISDATAQWTTSAVSQSRNKLAGTSAGGKAFFGGGFEGAEASNKVDIYTVSTGAWSTTALSEKRGALTATASPDSVFFAGGGSYDEKGLSKRVDIYSVSTGVSSTSANLSESRSRLASGYGGRKVIFAGGLSLQGQFIKTLQPTKTIDIYDLVDKNWSTAQLSEARSELAGVAAGGKIFFAGGVKGLLSYSKRVDIYDVATGNWSTADLSQARAGLAAVAAGGKVYFAGGIKGVLDYSDRVDIYDLNSGEWSQTTLSKKRGYLTATTVGDKVFFAGGEAVVNTIFTESVTTVDVFDLTTQSWSTDNLSKKRKDLASASVGNKALFAAGFEGLLDGGSTSRVDIYSATAIDQQPTPASSTVCQGSNVSSTITALGDELTYQWYKGEASTSGTLVDGQTSATLSLTNVQPSDSDSYYCKVNGLGGEAWSDAFVLSVNENPSAPVISMGGQSSISVIQNTPFVSLTITGCESGTIAWSGPNGAGDGKRSITVPTNATATLTYSATCTVGSCVSPAGSATVIVTPGTAVGNFDGYIYGADCSTFRGWAWDKNKINTPILVDILDGPNVIATIPADVLRQDLVTAGKGNGKHAFLFSIPESVKDNQSHYLSARIANGTFFLKDSPKAIICQPSGTSPGNQLPKPPSPTVIIAPLDAQVGVPFSATLVAFTDPEGTTLSYGLTGLPNGLTIDEVTRVISGIPTQDGTFVLTYKATDAGGASNSVSFNLTVSPASSGGVTGEFEGFLDKVECGTIRGWVWDRKKPNTPLTVEFYTDGTVWGSTVANIYRVDLKNAGKGNGYHAYSFEVPSALKDNVNRAIRARVQGSTYDLKDSGKMLQCSSAPVRLSAESVENLNVVLLGNPVKDQVTVEVRGVGGQPLGFALSDLQGRIIGERQIEKAAEVERQSFGLSAHPSGLFFLKVTANGLSRTLKVVKP
ncbi:putative Ig domain-containing protein [Larkinella rosea]|uniref:T9SS C-terminal target domain-containing protein n=1 Tax=Larkinella rosea TaxID=2025312 RepID=A0A3P1C1G5_9BACT|nr:putative Ig domain-containing protein [Larkinella rosea]RRB07117.1 T9SS C-terminal target domain-containing protein [Larkinella rosea]